MALVDTIMAIEAANLAFKFKWHAVPLGYYRIKTRSQPKQTQHTLGREANSESRVNPLPEDTFLLITKTIAAQNDILAGMKVVRIIVQG